AAGAGLDVLDAVVGDQRAVVADVRAQDLDAVVVGAGDGVAGDAETPGVERHHCRHRDVGKDVAGDVAGYLLEPDAAAAGAGDLAIGDADVAAAEDMDQPAPRRQWNAAAIEAETGQPDRIRAVALDR